MRVEFTAAALSMVAVPACAQPVAQTAGHCGPMWDNWGWMMIGPLHMILVLGVLIALIVLAARWLSQGTSRASPLDILDERYARGEIDKAEFEQKKQDLK